MQLKIIYFLSIIKGCLSNELDKSKLHLQYINSYKRNVISTPMPYFSNNYYESLETTICKTICKKNDIIFIKGEITFETANNFLQYTNKIISKISIISKSLSIFIDSPGGDMHARDIIINSINHLHHNNIKTYCYSGYKVASSATTILFLCNYRVARNHTNFLIHHAYYQSERKITEYEKHKLNNINNLMIYQYFNLINFKEQPPIKCSNSKYLLFQCVNEYIDIKIDFNKYIHYTEIDIKQTFDKGILTNSHKMLIFGFIDVIIF